MSLVLATLLAAAPATVPACSWDHPGVNPFMGDVVAAVDRYADIPADVRQRLKARMAKRDYDEIAVITRDGISGRAQYDAAIREMHFGTGQICKTVTRSRWTADWKERGLVYCEANHCIIVPTVCRNVSRISRLDPKVASANGRREEPLAPAKPAPDEGLLANAPLLSTLTPHGDSIDTVANAGGASGWPAWSTNGGASGGHWGGASGGGSTGGGSTGGSEGSPNGWGGFGTPSWIGAPAPGGLPGSISTLIPDRLVQPGNTNSGNTQHGESHAGGPGNNPNPGGTSVPTSHGDHGDEHPATPGGSATPGQGGTSGTPGGGGNGGNGGHDGGDDLPTDPLMPTVVVDLNPPTDPTHGDGGPHGANPVVVPLSGVLSPTVGTVPEPSSALLALLAVAAIGATRRARRS